MTQRSTVIGVFDNRTKAQQAINELKQSGFTEEVIGMTARDNDRVTTETASEDESYAAEGAAAGLAAGAGVGALWGLGVVAGALPAIGPAIAGGTLAAILSSAAAGAAAAGLAGTLIGLGIPKEEAEYYESEFQAGRVIVTVRSDGRASEAVAIMRRFGGYDMSSHPQPSVLETGAGLTHQGERTIQAREEKLCVTKQPVCSGEVDVRKEVHTYHKQFDVPVQREEVVVERHPASGKAASGPIGSGETIRVPVAEEQVRVEKQPVVKKEVTIGKRKTQSTERGEETVRKEDIKVEKCGDADVREQ